MTAYLIVQSTINNGVQSTINNGRQYQKYRDAVVPLIVKFGGRHVVRGGTVECLEGHHDGRRMAMFEFPSMEAIHAFWNSPEYVPVKEIRRGAAALDIWAVRGA